MKINYEKWNCKFFSKNEVLDITKKYNLYAIGTHSKFIL